MASGVRLYLSILVCALCTGPSVQDKIIESSNSKCLNNKTDLNKRSELQSSELVTDVGGELKSLLSIVNPSEETLKNVPILVKEEKGARPKDQQMVTTVETDEMLKGEPPREQYIIKNMKNVANEVLNNMVEAVDPLYQLEEELKTRQLQMYGEENEDTNRTLVNDTAFKTRIKRSEQSFEMSSSPSAGTTEVADLLKAGSEDQEVAAGHKSHKWSKGGGHKYKKEHHKKGGHKGDKGYKTKHHHKKGEHEKHGKDEHKKHYKKHSGHKKKHHDEAEKYGEHHKKEKGHKGAKYGEKKGHKKGHKTKGYHHKFHKDEYKKEHKFYDDYHKKGHHDKHGHHHKHHAKKAGKHKKGGHHKSAYHKDQYGKKGHKEKGHYDHEHKGHEGKKGHKKYHEHHSDHGKKGGHKEGKKWGYSKKHKHG